MAMTAFAKNTRAGAQDAAEIQVKAKVWKGSLPSGFFDLPVPGTGHAPAAFSIVEKGRPRNAAVML
jgi:hypothetical protein